MLRAGMRRRGREGAPEGRRNVLPLLLASLALAAAACVPTATIDRTLAYDGTPVRVEPGATVGLVVPFGYGDFGLQPGDLEPLPFPEIVFEPRDNVSGSFVLRAADAPEGWTVALDRVERVVRRIATEEEAAGGAHAPDAGRTYALEAYVRVSVPAGAEPGSYRVAATFRARNPVETTSRIVFTIPHGWHSHP